MIKPQIIPKNFYTNEEVKEKIISWSKSNSLPGFGKLIPNFFESMAKLDFPLDVWLVRDILYNSGHEVLKKDEMLRSLSEDITETFIKDVYSEKLIAKKNKGIKHAFEFITSLTSIAAETRCAKIIKKSGAVNINKKETPEDITCEYDGKVYKLQVKYKAEEDFPAMLIKEAIIGEMLRTSEDLLRKMSKICIKIENTIDRGFRKFIISYIHTSLVNDLLFKKKESNVNNIKAVFTYPGEVYSNNTTYLDIHGKNKHKNLSLTISFESSSFDIINVVPKVIYESSPKEALYKLLKNKINEINTNDNLIGWIDLVMDNQYSEFIATENIHLTLHKFLNKFSIPLVIMVCVEFTNSTLIITNDTAKKLPLIKKIVTE